MALISVVITTFRRPEWLAESVGSVLGQSFTDLECIVVDDGGGDLPPLPADDRLRVIVHEANLGVSAARNTGADAGTGTWMAFLDDDDRWTPDRLAMTLDVLDDADIVVCWAAELDGTPRPEWNRALDGDVHDVILDAAAPSLGATMIRRTVMPRFDVDYRNGLEDLDWWLRASRTLRVVTVPEVGLLVRLHRSERNFNGPLGRIDAAQGLMAAHAEYFRSHRRAAAFRWYMMAMLARQLGDYRFARRALVRSFVLRPKLKRLGHLALSCHRSTFDVQAHRAMVDR